ncbi:peptidylprolyl isomerase [Polynucleobacter sp. 15G-AUS-farblos]|uniref:FKBP-type peptidyl-prolyl cis-trans isomerase n=1 Tax=Polynucleobacter sp. 15G-AUS-farblos TaxID=2689094 RepID=UPI001C0AFAC2|nr:peptidylprolyl isomerase [Polynucleobacter sp. 15G-AUS-farblos]MBU3584338.1 peptidylprolyl isomerase [Polynucleobacter sp. 15G-AUS-farblos]
MKIEKNTIVSLRYKLTDAQNNVIEEPDSPMVYLHGGYEGTFPKIETLLDGQDIGYEATIQLEPNEAFGEYDPELLKIEPRTRFPEPLEVGMQFEGVPDADEESAEAGDDDADDEPLIYTVTDVADNQVVLDGNHPLAGMALRFWVQVEDVRAATEDEIENRHPEGGESFSFGMPNDDGDDEEEFPGSNLSSGEANPRTLH